MIEAGMGASVRIEAMSRGLVREGIFEVGLAHSPGDPTAPSSTHGDLGSRPQFQFHGGGQFCRVVTGASDPLRGEVGA